MHSCTGRRSGVTRAISRNPFGLPIFLLALQLRRDGARRFQYLAIFDWHDLDHHVPVSSPVVDDLAGANAAGYPAVYLDQAMDQMFFLGVLESFQLDHAEI